MKRRVPSEGVSAFNLFRICHQKTLTIPRVLYILLLHLNALVAQLVEHVLGKDEVTSSILVEGFWYGSDLPHERSNPLSVYGMSAYKLYRE